MLFLCVAAIAAAIICAAALLDRAHLTFKAEFYYVCYDAPPDAYSASSVSSLVHSYGGAGYIIKKGEKYFVTVSCYYDEEDAQSVVKNLTAKGLKCSVVNVKTGGHAVRGSKNFSAEDKKLLYDGNFTTLMELSEMCYSLANSLDDGSCNQQNAKSALSGVRTGLDALARNNSATCFAGEIEALRAECADVSYGNIYSRDVRRLQIAITDSIANVRLY